MSPGNDFSVDDRWHIGGWIALCALLSYFLFFSQLGALGFVGPDEPRYAQVARETAEENNWITPKLYGSPWFEKPMLYYWCAAIAYKMAGVNEVAARLPSAIAALLTAGAFAALAWRFYGWTVARLTFLLLAGSLGWLGFARAASIDMLFSACLNLAMAFLVLLSMSEDDEVRLRYAYGFHVMLGLALLAKGPAAVVLMAGTIAIYVWLAREREFLIPLLQPGPLGALVAIAAPWYLLTTLVNGWAFLESFLWAHNIERFFTPVFRHERGFWFFFVVLPLAIFPWTLLLAAPLGRLWRARRSFRREPSPELLLALWIVFPLLFFTLSRSKLPGYILPAVPALCLLLARELATEPADAQLRRWILAATGSVFVAALASPWILQAVSLPLTGARAYRIELVAVLVACCGVGWLALKRDVLTWVLALTLLTAGALEATNRFLTDDINRYFSARPLAQTIRMTTPWVVPYTYTFQVSRQITYGLNFYLGRALGDAEAEPIIEDTAYVILPEKKVEEAQKRLGRSLEVIERLHGEGLILVRATRFPPEEAPSGKN